MAAALVPAASAAAATMLSRSPDVVVSKEAMVVSYASVAAVQMLASAASATDAVV